MHTDQRFDPVNTVGRTQTETGNTAQQMDASANARELLRRGSVAAKQGDKRRGRELLLEAVSVDPRNEMAWLWLASVSESVEESMSCLQRVLAINPAHQQALEWSKKARHNLAQSLLARGVAAAKEGDTETARTLLARALEHDPEREAGWLWLASVTEAAEEKLSLLRHALILNPSNEQTRISVQRAQYSLARALLQSAVESAKNGERVAACELAERARNLDTKFEDAWVLTAQLAEDLEERASRLRRALGSIPTSTRVHAMLEETRRELNARAFVAEPHAPNLETPPTEVENPPPAEPSGMSPHDAPPQTAARTILVVDDSPTVRKLIAIKLEKEGHRVVPAVDGKDALAKLNDVVPDLIFTDITMPRMDGYQFCKLVRSDETTKHVPVIMLSGKDGFFDKVRGRMAGSTAYITKPFEPEALLKAVNDHCGAAGG